MGNVRQDKEERGEIRRQRRRVQNEHVSFEVSSLVSSLIPMMHTFLPPSNSILG